MCGGELELHNRKEERSAKVGHGNSARRKMIKKNEVKNRIDEACD